MYYFSMLSPGCFVQDSCPSLVSVLKALVSLCLLIMTGHSNTGPGSQIGGLSDYQVFSFWFVLECFCLNEMAPTMLATSRGVVKKIEVS